MTLNGISSPHRLAANKYPSDGDAKSLFAKIKQRLKAFSPPSLHGNFHSLIHVKVTTNTQELRMLGDKVLRVDSNFRIVHTPLSGIWRIKLYMTCAMIAIWPTKPIARKDHQLPGPITSDDGISHLNFSPKPLYVFHSSI
jgi:hypothetical protein